MKELLEQLITIKEKEKELKEERADLEGQIYDLMSDKLDDDKTVSFIVDEYKLSIKPNYAVKVDQVMAVTNSSEFKVKYEMSYSMYKKSTNKSLVDKIVTITQNKPTFTVEAK